MTGKHGGGGGGLAVQNYCGPWCTCIVHICHSGHLYAWYPILWLHGDMGLLRTSGLKVPFSQPRDTTCGAGANHDVNTWVLLDGLEHWRTWVCQSNTQVWQQSPNSSCHFGCWYRRAPVHSYRHTRREIKAALGVDIEQLFDSFDPQPLASGSIAQVHRATLKPAPYKQYLQQHYKQPAQPQHQQQEEGVQQEQQVVVKVCHPSVAEHIRMDFKLVGWLSIAASKLPLLRGLPVRESVAQFSHTMTAQADLRVEAVHALRFHNNFAGRLGRCVHVCRSSRVIAGSITQLQLLALHALTGNVS